MTELARLQRPPQPELSAVRTPTSQRALQRCGSRPSEARGCGHLQRSLRPSRVAAVPGDAAVGAVLRSPGHPLGFTDRARMEVARAGTLAACGCIPTTWPRQLRRALTPRRSPSESTSCSAAAPGNRERKVGRLLAHELVHVAQQQAAVSGRAAGYLETSRPDDPAEREASAVSESLLEEEAVRRLNRRWQARVASRSQLRERSARR